MSKVKHYEYLCQGLNVKGKPQESWIFCSLTEDHKDAHEQEVRPMIVQKWFVSVLIIDTCTNKHVKLDALSDKEQIHINLVAHVVIQLSLLSCHHALQLLLVYLQYFQITVEFREHFVGRRARIPTTAGGFSRGRCPGLCRFLGKLGVNLILSARSLIQNQLNGIIATACSCVFTSQGFLFEHKLSMSIKIMIFSYLLEIRIAYIRSLLKINNY